MREEGRAVLKMYVEMGGLVYNSNNNKLVQWFLLSTVSSNSNIFLKVISSTRVAIPFSTSLATKLSSDSSSLS
jgi:hypothetical protein